MNNNPNISKHKRIYILKAPIDIVHPDSLLEILSTCIKTHQSKQIMFVRVRDILYAHRNPQFLNMMNNAALVLPVSKMLVSMARFLRYPIPHCFYPFNTIISILTWIDKLQESMFLLGGIKDETVAIEQNLRLTFPGIRLLGRYHGLFSAKLNRSVTLAIAKVSPKLLLAGRGVSKYWLYYRGSRLNAGITIWTNEWFNIVLNKQKRPVKLAITRGHEWITELRTSPSCIYIFPLIFAFWLRLLFFRIFR